MDKVKVALEMIKKHHFWILCVVIVILGLMIWLTATASLAKQFTQKKGVLEGLFESLTAITKTPAHPNDEVVEAMEAKRDKLKQNVFVSWQKLYKEQKDKNRLPIVSDLFTATFEDEEIPAKARYDYMEFIPDHIPSLFDERGANIVRLEGGGEVSGAEPAAESAGAATRFGMSTETPGEGTTVGTVEWDPDDRELLLKRFRWTTAPTTQEVRDAQEDLWIYEALVRIIRNTNKHVGYSEKECTATHNANIKRIFALEIGSRAIKAWDGAKNKVVTLPGVAAAGTGGGGSPDPTSDPSHDNYGANITVTDAHRYVDETGRPLEVGEKPPYAEYKIMLIHMKLAMNQMMIPKLLVECANSSMPIEVVRVRLQPDQGGSPLVLSRVADNDVESGAGQMATRSPTNYNIGRKNNSLGNSVMPVEILGFIYIYNPPDKDKLGTGAAAEKPEEDEPEEGGTEEGGTEEGGTEEGGTEEGGTEEGGTEEGEPKEGETKEPESASPSAPATPATRRPGAMPMGRPGTMRPGMGPMTAPAAPKAPATTPANKG